MILKCESLLKHFDQELYVELNKRKAKLSWVKGYYLNNNGDLDLSSKSHDQALKLAKDIDSK